MPAPTASAPPKRRDGAGGGIAELSCEDGRIATRRVARCNAPAPRFIQAGELAPRAVRRTGRRRGGGPRAVEVASLVRRARPVRASATRLRAWLGVSGGRKPARSR